ncbi:hypothetical protein D9615_003759 [Tricholomella constricta]|uniref:Uncharacterized protein n=1 Tax=Tricholomella constricta TaxID=117010 RepID=A0A8H5HIG2_9AGAR|nr:hypothetical protein D9615_003759 [Tricholomella constricta]
MSNFASTLESSKASLQTAGLIVLANLTTIPQRTALTGSASLLDILFLAPGIHLQQNAPTLHGGELPATGAMTTGYVFRVENPATVSYLQRVGLAGHLVTYTSLNTPTTTPRRPAPPFSPAC